MDLIALRQFVATAEEGSVTRAAQRLGVSQPTVSQQIAKLERELSTQLFDRLGRGMSLTDQGRDLLERAREIILAVENAERAIRSAGDGVSGRLRVGSIATFAQFGLPSMVAEFVRDFPEVELIIHESVSDDLISRTVDGELDLAIVSRTIPSEPLVLEPLFSETYKLALPRRHPLTSRRRIRVEDLRDFRFVLLEPRTGLPVMALEFCRANGFEPRIACRGAQLATVQAMVGAGLGISFVPTLAAEADRSRRRVYRDLTGERPSRTVSLAFHRLRRPTPAAHEFTVRLRQHARTRVEAPDS
ncbi:MAG: LysR family transcriptional regulator [Phycisphaerales bacterium]